MELTDDILYTDSDEDMPDGISPDINNTDPNIINDILENKKISFQTKNKMVTRILLWADVNATYRINITPKTVSILLHQKNDNDDFLDIYSKIINYSRSKNNNIFTYQHLYYLVLQEWADPPDKQITLSLRMDLVKIGLFDDICQEILEQINGNLQIWFANFNKNDNITSMIDLLCEIDTTGALSNIRDSFIKNYTQTVEDKKLFVRTYNMSQDEYEIKKNRSKSNGLCKYVRENKICPYGNKCNFYHGKLEETYGVQYCKKGNDCIHFTNGTCKFLHKPTSQQLNKTLQFYSSLKRSKNGYSVSLNKSKNVDYECKNNPFIILQKNETNDRYVEYNIPICCAQIEKFGTSQKCGKQVSFMTNSRTNKKPNFYCSYEHMYENEPDSDYIIKQNIVKNIVEIK